MAIEYKKKPGDQFMDDLMDYLKGWKLFIIHNRTHHQYHNLPDHSQKFPTFYVEVVVDTQLVLFVQTNLEEIHYNLYIIRGWVPPQSCPRILVILHQCPPTLLPFPHQRIQFIGTIVIAISISCANNPFFYLPQILDPYIVLLS